MARRRFYVSAIRDGRAEILGDEARHLARVLRAEGGQRYEISDGQAAYLAEIAEAGAGRVAFQVVEAVPSAELPARVTLCASLVKFDRFEWIVEKATELGAERLLPVDALRSEKGLRAAAAKRCERWRKIAFESGQQCRRLGPPEVLDAVDFTAALRVEADYRFFLDEAATAPLLSLVPRVRTRGDRISLLTGPEGGWTEDERARAAAAGWPGASLGGLVLRAETAALAGLAAIAAAWMA